MKTEDVSIKRLNNYTAVFLKKNSYCWEWQVFDDHEKCVAHGNGTTRKYALDSARRRIKTEVNKAKKLQLV
tara:strand:- start:3812 stop:4024 length:213 start_codon:yes stop_codon:yes gene_type:complete